MNMTSNLSRRGFLAAGAALGALAATGGTTWLEERPAQALEGSEGSDEVRHAFCQMCGPACTLSLIHI